MTQTTTQKKPAGRMESALTSARSSASGALDKTRKAAEGNPLAVIGGGIAIGLALGALLPRTKRETALLGPVGKRLTGAAAGAAEAAKDAARAELGSLPLSKDAARAQVSKLLDQVGKALSAGGEAALATRDEPPAPKKAARKAK